MKVETLRTIRAAMFTVFRKPRSNSLQFARQNSPSVLVASTHRDSNILGEAWRRYNYNWRPCGSDEYSTADFAGFTRLRSPDACLGGLLLYSRKDTPNGYTCLCKDEVKCPQ